MVEDEIIYVRIAIIDHMQHRLYIEDIEQKILDQCYGGEEEKYIADNYDLVKYSWDYIVDAVYFPLNEKDPIEIEFENIGDSYEDKD